MSTTRYISALRRALKDAEDAFILAPTGSSEEALAEQEVNDTRKELEEALAEQRFDKKGGFTAYPQLYHN